jgi:hypothetical protein
VSHVGPANMQLIKCQMSFPDVACSRNPCWLRLTPDGRKEATTYAAEGTWISVAGRTAGVLGCLSKECRSTRYLLDSSFENDPVLGPLWSWPEDVLTDIGHKGHASPFLQTSRMCGVRQSPQMKPCRVSR